MQHGLQLDLNKTKFLTTHPNEADTITLNDSDLPRAGYFFTHERNLKQDSFK